MIGNDDNGRSAKLFDLLLNNQYITYDRIIVNAFSNYFVKVGRSPVKKNILSLYFMFKH